MEQENPRFAGVEGEYINPPYISEIPAPIGGNGKIEEQERVEQLKKEPRKN